MPSESRQPFLDAVAAIVGPQHVLTDDLASYETDWRRRTRGQALAVVRPKTTQEVAQVVKACAEHAVPVVTQGGNTGLAEGAIPDGSGTQLVMQLGRMTAIRAVDEDNLTVTLEAGCVLQVIQERMHERGLLFPLSLGAEGSCTIGGNLATNAGGTQVLRYGNARELCLGLEVVTPQGEIWHGLSGLRKDNTGLDLRDLFVGSEGALGIITAATLKLFPQPAAVLTAWAPVASVEQAIALLSLARRRMRSSLTGFELMDRFGLGLVARHMPQLRVPLHDQGSPYSVLIECSDEESEEHARQSFERLLEAALEAGLISDAVVAETVAQARQMWHVRESLTMAQVMEGPNIKHDISIPISRIAEFVASASADLLARFPGSQIVNFGHLGDGNLHFNLAAPPGEDARSFVDRHEHTVQHMVYDKVAQLGGSISAEHGIGALKREALGLYKCPTALGLMQSIKRAIDPRGLMNPGKLLAPQA